MNRFLYTLLGCLLSVALLTSCSEDDKPLSDIVVIVSPGKDSKVSLYAGEKTLYEVTLTTANDNVASYKITSFDPVNGLTTLLSEKCGQKNYSFQFAYSGPEFDREAVDVTLTFEATDNLGNKVEAKRRVTVLNRAITMSEATGIILFMPGRGLANALSLSDVSDPFSLADSPTPEKADVYVELTEDTNQIEWRSMSQTKFVRYNQFNYASATAASIRSVYNSSIHTDYVGNVCINDIIVVGHASEAQGVFFVSNIIFNSDGAPEFMQLSYKGILPDSTTVPDQPSQSE